MPETVTNDPTIAKVAATVSASALAQHLDCSRTYIGKLEAEGVIQRQGDGFPLDQSRVAYLRYLRRERQQSPRAEADAAHVAAKTEMLQLRLMEKKRELVQQDDVNELIDQLCGIGDASERHGGPLQPRHSGEAQHRRGGDADQARDQRGVQQGGRRMHRAAA
jgi:hypothetical protein